MAILLKVKVLFVEYPVSCKVFFTLIYMCPIKLQVPVIIGSMALATLMSCVWLQTLIKKKEVPFYVSAKCINIKVSARPANCFTNLFFRCIHYVDVHWFSICPAHYISLVVFMHCFFQTSQKTETELKDTHDPGSV